MYDDYGDSGDWGYNGDADHDMWVDYTTDMYEGSDYTGEKVARYQAELDKLKAAYEPMKIQSEQRRTRLTAIVCAAISIIAILIAIVF